MLERNLFHFQTYPGVGVFYQLYHEDLTVDTLKFVIESIQLCQQKFEAEKLDDEANDKKGTTTYVMFPEDQDGVENWVDLARMRNIVTKALKGLNQRHISEVVKKCENCACLGPLSKDISTIQKSRAIFAQTKRIKRDTLIYIMVIKRRDMMKKQIQFFKNLFKEGGKHHISFAFLSENKTSIYQ